MIRLPTIEHAPGLMQEVQSGARVASRVAVKAVIWEGERLRLLHSQRWSCYKFAGGGTETGESHAVALARELREELGAELLELGLPLLTVTELSWAQEAAADVFQMDSFYYPCQVRSGQHPPTLEAYEAELGLTPCLVTPAEAAQANAWAQRQTAAPRWLRREVAVLRALEQVG